jgi:uncharacterized protein (UPF0147 family)
MADPVIILISLAPFILDLLFGEGKKRSKINPRYNKMDKAMLMSGQGYPREKDYKNKEAFYDAYGREYAKYAVKSSYNPWVLLLEKSGFYDRMKQELEQLSDIYNKIKEDAGIPKPPKKDITDDPIILKALKIRKTKEIKKLESAKNILEQISSDEPNPIQEEFLKLIGDEYERAMKMGFTKDDVNNIYTRSFERLVRAIEKAKNDLKKYESKIEEVSKPKPPPPPLPPPEAAVAKGYGRVSYKRMAKELARKHGIKLPRSARQEGKTWKGIYMGLTTVLK